VLVSATLTDEVLQQFRPYCPNLVPVFIGRQNSQTAAEPSATEYTHSVADSGTAAAGQPRWGWDEATGGPQPAKIVRVCGASLASLRLCCGYACVEYKQTSTKAPQAGQAALLSGGVHLPCCSVETATEAAVTWQAAGRTALLAAARRAPR